MLKCNVDHILQEFYSLFLTSFRTYNIASPPLTKMTSKDDIKELVSLKFFRPFLYPFSPPATTAVFGSYLTSLYSLTNTYRRCGIAYPYDWRSWGRTHKEDECGPLLSVFNPLWTISSAEMAASGC